MMKHVIHAKEMKPDIATAPNAARMNKRFKEPFPSANADYTIYGGKS